MERIIQITADGSCTIAIPEMEVTYHSKHGAIMESTHVFINAALAYMLESAAPDKKPLRILEIGFGTGLNALLTAIEAGKKNRNIIYTTIEPFPLNPTEYEQLNYGTQLNAVAWMNELQNSSWEAWHSIGTHFEFYKHKTSLQQFDHHHIAHALSMEQTSLPDYDVIYFDVFAPRAQAELWEAGIFKKLYNLLAPGGILTTYCSKTVVRRAMEAGGFTVQKIQGPYGKREMVRAIKPG